MFKFNSNHIFTGHIKQILNAFNLPSYKVYTAKHHKYFLENGVESPELINGLYIKYNKILEYKDGKWNRDFDSYGYNKKIPNFTKNFPICNNKYDSDTHEYLGDFLRFQRDYLGIDLMPLYNCFSNRICNNINLAINKKLYTTKIKTDDNGQVIYKIENGQVTETPETEEVLTTTRLRRAFYSQDTGYIIYMLPVKFFQKYTIAMDCSYGVDICCGLFTDYLHELPEKLILNDAQAELPPADISQFLSDATFKKLPDLRFNNPVLWEGITLDTINTVVNDCIINATTTGTSLSEAEKRAGYKSRLINSESCLKLFIKVPVKAKTSIVILEGDYREFNNCKYAPETKTKHYTVQVTENINGEEVTHNIPKTYTYTEWVKKQNHFVTNYETILYSEIGKDKFITTELPDVEDREFIPISPLQLLMLNTKESYPFADRLMEYLSENVVTEWDTVTDNIRRAQKVIQLNRNSLSIPCAWEGKMRNILYDYMMTGKPSGEQFTSEIAHDVLGYVDKDVEKFYTAWSLEFCRDSDGNRIPLTEYINGEWVQVYGIEPKVLQEAEQKLLLDKKRYLLTTSDVGTIPLYEQKYVPIGSIGTINIYDEED